MNILKNNGADEVRRFPSLNDSPNRHRFLIALAAGLSILLASQVYGQEDPGVRVEHLRGNVHALYAAWGIEAVSIGSDGVYLIDDDLAGMTPKIMAAIREISTVPIRLVLNTHDHGDHTGGNEHMQKEGAVIVAHENVRTRLIETPRGGSTPPVLTFNDQFSIHLNGEEARAVHVGHAHTDGDSIVFFSDSNIVHMGDIFFHKLYPYIDIDGGGDVDGVIAAVEYALGEIDDDTIVIPGHGEITDMTGLQDYLTMLTITRDRIVKLREEGKSLEEVISAQPGREYDSVWSWDHIDSAEYIESVYQSAD